MPLVRSCLDLRASALPEVLAPTWKRAGVMSELYTDEPVDELELVREASILRQTAWEMLDRADAIDATFDGSDDVDTWRRLKVKRLEQALEAKEQLLGRMCLVAGIVAREFLGDDEHAQNYLLFVERVVSASPQQWRRIERELVALDEPQLDQGEEAA